MASPREVFPAPAWDRMITSLRFSVRYFLMVYSPSPGYGLKAFIRKQPVKSRTRFEGDMFLEKSK
jgi:hypothetical protein